MADISQVQVGSTTYDVHDATARNYIANIKNSSVLWDATTDSFYTGEEKSIDNLLAEKPLSIRKGGTGYNGSNVDAGNELAGLKAYLGISLKYQEMNTAYEDDDWHSNSYETLKGRSFVIVYSSLKRCTFVPAGEVEIVEHGDLIYDQYLRLTAVFKFDSSTGTLYQGIRSKGGSQNSINNKVYGVYYF